MKLQFWELEKSRFDYYGKVVISEHVMGKDFG